MPDQLLINEESQKSKNPSEQTIFNAYLDAVGGASRRSRLTLIIMITASVLALAGFWNSSQISWLKKRIQVAQNGFDWFHFPDDTSITSYVGDDSTFYQKIINRYNSYRINFPVGLKFLNNAYSHIVGENSFHLPYGVRLKIPMGIQEAHKNGNLVNADSIEIKPIRLAAKFISVREINSREQLGRMLNSFDKINFEDVLVIKVPFFGVSFDVNDLGLWSGIAFLIILLMFRFILARELKNLRYVFKIAREQGLLE